MSRAGRLASSGVALLALLALVALASRGHRPSGGGPSRAHHSADLVIEYGILVAALVGLALFLFLVYALVTGRGGAALPARKEWMLRLFVAMVVIAVGLTFLAARFLRRLHGRGSSSPAQTAPLATPRPGKPPAPAPDQTLRFEWTPVIVVGAVALAALVAAVIVYLRTRPRRDTRETSPAERLSDVLDDTLDDLRAERDPRRAVIAAYARMERALGSYGLPRRLYEAPLEYLARVLLELQASASAVGRLTDLFERAKFSRHEIDETMKNEAIGALEALRAELRGAT